MRRCEAPRTLVPTTCQSRRRPIDRRLIDHCLIDHHQTSADVPGAWTACAASADGGWRQRDVGVRRAAVQRLPTPAIAGRLAGRGRGGLQHGRRNPADVSHQGLGVARLQRLDLRMGDEASQDVEVGVVADGDGDAHGLLAPRLGQQGVESLAEVVRRLPVRDQHQHRRQGPIGHRRDLQLGRPPGTGPCPCPSSRRRRGRST